ncbi:hypothetical protein B9Z65_5414 [Elsinoe australis]|uniref:Uncharacterized protein n=1 Tax=Elsinoe australis TaxID=40998 RepID=A0A2P7ZE01_9PEZI|nr:hypothetical protein B9Z65_5414 [Elsinoe australis]
MSYIAELFENFMEYKQLIKTVQDIISNPTKYKAQDNKNNAITTSIPQLVAVKSAFRREMQKIVSVVDLFSKDPDALHRSQALSKEPSDDVVRKIMRVALEISDTVGSSAPAESSATARNGSTVSTASSYSVVGAESLPGDKVAAMLNSLLAPKIWIDVLPVAIEELAPSNFSIEAC